MCVECCTDLYEYVEEDGKELINICSHWQEPRSQKKSIGGNGLSGSSSTFATDDCELECC
jgi:hypothetical protein